MRANGLPPLTIIKLGGSLALSPHLRPWLAAIAAHAGVVVVPGGGPFADAVRAAQAPMGFDHSAAHRMALQAMEQYGLALTSLHPGLALASSRAAIVKLVAQKLAPVWAPQNMAMRARLPASWDLTSDSLAAWLAGKLGAQRLVLIKHGSFAGAQSVADLARLGIVDPLFPRYLARAQVPAWLAAPHDHDRLQADWRGARLTPIIGLDALPKSVRISL